MCHRQSADVNLNPEEMPPSVLKIGKAANDQLALTNCLIVNRSDFPTTAIKYILINNQFAFTIL
jgi:hypothetical protein